MKDQIKVIKEYLDKKHNFKELLIRVKTKKINKIEYLNDVYNMLQNSLYNCQLFFKVLNLSIEKPCFALYSFAEPRKQIAQADFKGEKTAFIKQNLEKILKDNKIPKEDFFKITNYKQNHDTVIYYMPFFLQLRDGLKLHPMKCQIYSDIVTMHEYAHLWQDHNNIDGDRGVDQAIAHYFEFLHERMYTPDNVPVFEDEEFQYLNQGNKIIKKVLGNGWMEPKFFLEKAVREGIKERLSKAGILEKYRQN